MTSENADSRTGELPESGIQTRRRIKLPVFLDVPWGIRDVILLVVGWFGLQVLLGVALVFAARWIPALNDFWQLIVTGDIVASFILNLAVISIEFALVGGMLAYYRVGWRMVGWRKVNVWRAIGLIAVILVLFVAVANGVLWLVETFVPGFNANQPQVNEFTQGAGAHRNLALIALVLIPPFVEETIFRGFMFPAISKRIGLVGGAVVSSVLFGLAHAQANIFVYTAILGLLLCYLYRRTGSIIPGIALHMINNYLAFLSMTGK